MITSMCLHPETELQQLVSIVQQWDSSVCHHHQCHHWMFLWQIHWLTPVLLAEFFKYFDWKYFSESLIISSPDVVFIRTLFSFMIMTELKSFSISIDQQVELVHMNWIIIEFGLSLILDTLGDCVELLLIIFCWFFTQTSLQTVFDPGGHKQTIRSVGISNLFWVPDNTTLLRTQLIIINTMSWPVTGGLQSSLAELMPQIYKI